MADDRRTAEALFDEMKGRIKEDDSSVPMKDGPYAYGSSYEKGGEQPRFFRTPRDGGAEEILLDGDTEAEGKAYFRLGGIDHSSDHARLIWAYDDKGSEFFTLRIRDLATGRDLDDLVPDTGGGGVWDAGNDGFFYTRLDDNHRPSKIFFHELGTDVPQDRLVYEEAIPASSWVSAGPRTNDWILISIHDHETSEYRLLAAPTRPPTPQLVARARAASNTSSRKAATSSSS